LAVLSDFLFNQFSLIGSELISFESPDVQSLFLKMVNIYLHSLRHFSQKFPEGTEAQDLDFTDQRLADLLLFKNRE